MTLLQTVRKHLDSAPRVNSSTAFTIVLSLLFLSHPVQAATDFAASAPERLSAYLKIDTINPPGNESRGVAYLAKILDEAGIAYTTAESEPGRGNLWARLKGGDQPGLVLLHHIDVVPANRKYWTFDPLSGAIKDGYVYGRGAIDTKGLGIVQLQAFLALHKSGVALNRDVWLVATADEEEGGLRGAGWLVENRPEIFANVGYLLNEGGSARRYGDQVAVMLEVTQKVPLWLRMTAHGRPGHGSMPQPETAVTRLLGAAERIAGTQFPVRVIEPVRAMLEGVAPYQDSGLRQQFASVSNAVQEEGFLLNLQLQSPGTHALLRNTCSVTRLSGSSKINVVPAEASAELDCRLLPDQNPNEFLRDLTALVNDERIEFATIMSFTPAISSTDTALFRTIAAVARAHFADAALVPTVSAGFTDSHFFRDLGITSYGYAPFVFTDEEFRGVHGNDERISVQNMVDGTRIMIDLLERFVQED